MRLRLPALLLASLLGCDRADEAAGAQAQALQAATEELATARAAFEADRATTQQELAELRKAVDAANAKLDALAERRSPSAGGRPSLPGFPPLAPDAEVTPVSEMASAVAAAVRCESETRCTIDHAFVETLVINPGSLAKQARVVPAVRDGVGLGFKLYGIRPGSLPKALSLKNGDLVRSVNGYELSSVEQALEAYAKLREEKRFTVELERKGMPITLTIEIVGRP